MKRNKSASGAKAASNGPPNGMAELEVIFDDTEASIPHNKELIRYFKNNLDNLNRAGLRFKWRIAIKEEYPMYKEQGIKHFPAMIMPPKKLRYGVKEIIKEIGIFINQRKRLVGTASTIHNGMAEVSDEALYEYQKRAIGRAEDDEEERTENFDMSYRKRQTDMLQRRQSAGMASKFDANGEEIDNLGGGGGTSLKRNMFAADYQLNVPKDRQDNIPMRDDPSESLQKLRNKGGADSRDIDLMQMHLDKMETSGGSSMDYF